MLYDRYMYVVVHIIDFNVLPPPPPGFDPWDVSQQGLADLLDQEEEATPPHYRGVTGHSHKPRPFPASAGLISEHASSESRSWKAEFRALFPNVNISFGGGGIVQCAMYFNLPSKTTFVLRSYIC